jgi:hypothetical protein
LDLGGAADPGEHEQACSDAGQAEDHQAWIGPADAEDRPAGELAEDQQS